MKETKHELRFFTIPQWKQEELYLQNRHKQGWKFVNVTFPGLYTFKRCVPEDVIYQLDYNSDSQRERAEYLQIFQDCGWEYLQDFVGYSYFRKPASEAQGNEEIFCDDASRADMMKRVFKGRMIPLLLIFFLIIIPQFFVQSISRHYILAGIFLSLGLLYLILFAIFAYQYWRYQVSLK